MCFECYEKDKANVYLLLMLYAKKLQRDLVQWRQSLTDLFLDVQPVLSLVYRTGVL
jgi:hypothetical protein